MSRDINLASPFFTVRERRRSDLPILAECIPKHVILSPQPYLGSDRLAQDEAIRTVRAAILCCVI